MTLIVGGLSIYLFLAVALSIYLGAFSLSKGRSKVNIVFSLLSAAITFFLFGYLMELNSPSLERMYFWNHIQYIGLPFLVPLWLLVALVYSGIASRLPRILAGALFIIPALTFIFRHTNYYHHFFYTGYWLKDFKGFDVMYLHRGAWYWVNMTYMTLGLLLATAIYLKRFREDARGERKGYALLLSASLLPYIGQILIAVDFMGGGIDYAALIFPVSLVMVFYAITRHDALAIKTLARGTVFDNNREVMMLFDRGNRLVDCNRSAFNLFPQLAEAHHLQPDKELFPEHPTIVEMFEGNTDSDRERTVSIDGRYYEARLSVIKNSDGRFAARLLSFRDMTQRKQTEEERTRLMAAIEQAEEIVMIVDMEANIQYVNPAFEKITGYSREEAIGRNPRFLQSGKHDPEFYHKLWNTITSGTTWRGRMVNKTKDGSFYTEEAAISPVQNSEGRTVNYVAVKRDITEHLQMTEHLQHAQRLESVGRLAGGVAHDFNNILTGINGFTRFAIETLPDDSEVREDLQEVVKLAGRAEELTRQLLAFSRRQPLQTQVINLNSLAEEMSRILQRLIGENIELDIITADDLRDVEVDPSQIEHVLINLAINARDAMPEGGRLSIETMNVLLDNEYANARNGVSPGEYVMLAISDNGEGMSAEVQRKIFEPFYTTKSPGEGSGLGLAMVYGIVKQHGGNIWVYSEPGAGATFKIFLPATKADAPEYIKPLEESELSAGGTETIMVVEDEKDVCDVVGRMLESCGYTVVKAASPAEAGRILEARGAEIDLLLTDVVLPERNGRRFYEEARSRHPHLRVLYMSGYTDNAIVVDGILSPDALFIQKPFAKETLILKVREALDG